MNLPTFCVHQAAISASLASCVSSSSPSQCLSAFCPFKASSCIPTSPWHFPGTHTHGVKPTVKTGPRSSKSHRATKSSLTAGHPSYQDSWSSSSSASVMTPLACTAPSSGISDWDTVSRVSSVPSLLLPRQQVQVQSPEQPLLGPSLLAQSRSSVARAPQAPS